MLFEYRKVDSFDINVNGIQVIENAEQIEIYNDPFRTVPIFIATSMNGDLIIFSKFEEFFRSDVISNEIDSAGFWEIVIYGGALWTRTLYKNVKQMPGASKLSIDKHSNKYTIERYWDYAVEEDSSIDSAEKAAAGLHDKLDDIFSKLNKSNKYIMGMSGGMDSRITLAFISKHIPKDNVKLFTYGFNEKILEFKYAKLVAGALGFSQPVFHKLTKRSYQDALNYMPRMSGGQIGINHCHILDYIKSNQFSEKSQISTYFSDAVFGWDCVQPKTGWHGDSNNPYISQLNKYRFLPETVSADIIGDARKIFIDYDQSANFSSASEYKYVTERNQKFHTYLASLQADQIPNKLIYANTDLLKYALSIPIKYRAQKALVDLVLSKYFKNISSSNFKNISSRFQWGHAFSGRKDWYRFRLTNRINVVLRIITKGKLQLINKYQTEEQERILRENFYEELKLSTSKFVDLGVLTLEQKSYFDKLPLGSAGVGERFALISLSALF